MKPLILFALLAPASFAITSTLVAHADPATPRTAPPLAAPSMEAKASPNTAHAPNTAAAPKAAAATRKGKGSAQAPMVPAKNDAEAEHDHEGMPEHAHDADESNATPFGLKESNTDYFWRRSDQAFHDGDYDRAVANHKAIVALDPSDTESFGVATWLLWSMGKKDEANAHLQRGLKLNPQSADMWDTAAQQYDLEKRLPEARDAYVNALKFTPAGENTMMLRRRLAHAAEKAGDKTLALQTWRDLVKEFPNDPVNRNNLTREEKAQTVVASIGNFIKPLRLEIGAALAGIRARLGLA